MYVEQLRASGERLELVRDGPARGPRHGAEGELLFARIDLHDDPVDLVRERRALVARLQAFFDDGLYGVVQFVRVRPQAVFLHPVEHRGVALEALAALADAVEVDLERPPGRNPGVELPDGPGGGVTRVGERGLPLFFLPPVELLEVFERHVHLAPRFDDPGRVVVERVWDGADGTEVGRHVFADGPVAARRPTGEASVLVAQRDGEAVDLPLGDVAWGLVLAEQPSHAGVPLPQILDLAGVCEGEHGNRVPGLLETLDRFAAYPLGGRVRGDQLRALAFQFFQLPVQGVVLGVGDLRCVLDVVAAVVVTDLLTQILYPALNVHASGHAGIIRTDARAPKGFDPEQAN